MKTENYSPETEQLLLSIAKTQRQLLDTVFDFKSHEIILAGMEHKRFFKSKSQIKKESLLSRLDDLRSEAQKRTGSIGPARWWQIPWDDMEVVLCMGLAENERENGWRFESELRSFDTGSDARCLILSEEGASQQFSAERIYQAETISPYSAQERREIMDQFDKSVRDRYSEDQREFEMSDAVGVRSALTGNAYKDVMDYYYSEGCAVDYVNRSRLEQRLSADKYTEGVSAQSVARYRVKGMFAVGLYQTDVSGILTGFKALDFEPIVIEPEEFRDVLTSRRTPGLAALKLCEFLAGDSDTGRVPFSILSEIAGVAETEEEMGIVRLQSALLTILADKLVLT